MKKTTPTPDKGPAPKSNPGTERPLSVGDAVQLAVKLQRQGNFEPAERIYQSILSLAPDHADALHFLGLLRHQQRDFVAARDLIEHSLRVAPKVAGFWNNYGNVLVELKRPEDAIDAYKACLEIDENFADAYNNLGVVQRAKNNYEIAAAAYQRAVELRPDFADAYSNFSALRMAQNQLTHAVELGLKAFTLRPENAKSRRTLGYAFALSGETEMARQVYLDWLKDEPENPIPRHHLATVGAAAMPERASDAYVRSIFDTFAASFDIKLAYLHYRLPDMLTDIVAKSYGAPQTDLDVLDVGCGTGLCGPKLRPYARRLVGVDLSPNMLNQARERHCYDQLNEAELSAHLKAHVSAYDLIVAADTLCYLGELTGVFAATSASLRAGGRLFFSVELLAVPQEGYRLDLHGRYTHSEAYIRSSLKQSRLTVTGIMQADLRLETGKPVAGLLVSAVKT